MSGIEQVPTNVAIQPPVQIGGDYISGFPLAITTFIIGAIFILLTLWYIFTVIFGQPLAISKAAATQGSIIQHFNTSKSAVMKLAAISGGAFRYANIRDGTVAATAGSVNNIRGRNMVLTFAQLGVTIPVHLLGGVSVLVHNGINNINDLRNKLKYIEIRTEKRVNPNTLEEEVYEVERVEKMKNEVVVEGYDFNNFETLIKQSEEEKLIPLVVESVPDFVERNISADYTEKKIKIREQLNTKGQQSVEHWKFIGIAIAVVIIFVVGMAIK